MGSGLDKEVSYVTTCISYRLFTEIKNIPVKTGINSFSEAISFEAGVCVSLCLCG